MKSEQSGLLRYYLQMKILQLIVNVAIGIIKVIIFVKCQRHVVKIYKIKVFLLQVLKDDIKNLIRLMMGAVNNLRSQVNVFNECYIMFE